MIIAFNKPYGVISQFTPERPGQRTLAGVRLPEKRLPDWPARCRFGRIVVAERRTGAVVLINFPFTDGSSAKKRPASVLLDSGDNDLLLARITTQFSDSPFDCERKYWAKAGLKAPSFARLQKLATLEKKLVEKEFGILTASDLRRVLETLQKVNQKISQL